ncbi:MAG: helix-turn-helix domain-containing protein [Victivallales bacterium]|jgi:DNA-binding IclR family transcriptional regulator|nr:helix-turn-helix domain-containing protein [Victivallales bacterium]
MYQTVKSVKKAMTILESVTGRAMENKFATLQEIAREAGIPPATARSLLRTLEECGYIGRKAHGRYQEGPKCFQLFQTGNYLRKLPALARPLLEKAVENTGETFLLTALLHGRRIELLRLGVEERAGREMSFHANADLYQMRTTRVILAWYSPEEVDFFLERNGMPTVEDWPEAGGSREGLATALHDIRYYGGCSDRLELLTATAVPILSPNDEILGALGCYSPLTRTDVVRQAGIFAILRECAEAIRAALKK